MNVWTYICFRKMFETGFFGEFFKMFGGAPFSHFRQIAGSVFGKWKMFGTRSGVRLDLHRPRGMSEENVVLQVSSRLVSRSFSTEGAGSPIHSHLTNCAFRCVPYLEFNEKRCARTPPSQCSRVGARLSRCRQPLAREDPHSVVMGRGQDMTARYSPVVIKRCRWAQPSCRFLTWQCRMSSVLGSWLSFQGGTLS